MTRDPEREDVHVVVLDALMGRVRVVADRGPDAADLVRRDARADAGAADEDPALGLAVADRVAEPRGEVRVVVRRIGAVAAEVDQLVAEVAPRPAAASSSSLRAAPAWSAANATRIGRPLSCGPDRTTASDRRPDRRGRERRLAAAAAPAGGPARGSAAGRGPSPSRTPRATSATRSDGEPELLEDRPGRRRRPEVVEPDDRALVAGPAVPAERDTGLDGDPGPDRAAAGRTRGMPRPGARTAPSTGATRPARRPVAPPAPRPPRTRAGAPSPSRSG